VFEITVRIESGNRRLEEGQDDREINLDQQNREQKHTDFGAGRKISADCDFRRFPRAVFFLPLRLFLLFLLFFHVPAPGNIFMSGRFPRSACSTLIFRA